MATDSARAQLKAIQDELGEGEKPEAQELRKRIVDAKLPEHVAAVVSREVDRMERMTPASPEAVQKLEAGQGKGLKGPILCFVGPG